MRSIWLGFFSSFFFLFFLGRSNFFIQFFWKISPNFSKTSGIYTRKTRFNFRKFLFLQKKLNLLPHTHELHVGFKFIKLLKYVFIYYNNNSVILFYFFSCKI
jgi:hypothetical protein